VTTPATVVNALSVDVEEYFHASIFRAATRTLGSRRFESRVQQSVERLLGLLSDGSTRATFFTLGEVARTHPSVIRAIAAAHHEIACHGERHEDVSAHTPRRFRRDVRRAKARLEDLAGTPVIGYRAPNFSIGSNQGWAYEILLEEGFRYDSSVYPIVHDRYGDRRAPRFPYPVFRNGAGALIEFPVGTARLFGVNLPIGGGGFFRVSPVALICRAIRHVNVRERQPIMFYMHPWELDPGQPRPPMSWHHQFRHYVGIEREAEKFASLLDHLTFNTARDVLRLHPTLATGSLGTEVSVATA
jgi:polysaccharide deacetylase family protein (PEP-CTERM system associated)